MSKSRRFPGNFFKSFREDPILDDTVGLMDFSATSTEEDQVASLAVYLCSDAASQITGANLSIDGGWTAA